jgi:hypothetical protein
VTELDAFISKFTPEVQKLARAALLKMRKRLPGATQLVYDNYNALAVAFSPTDLRSDIILSIALYPHWVSLFFMRGVTLPDPHRLLRGGGSSIRHLVLQKASDLDKPEVAALIDAAVDRAIPPFDRKRRGETIVKMQLKNQRARRPGA